MLFLFFIQNEFDLNLDEVPEIYTTARYLVRNPDLKNNWRGRKREDINGDLWVS